MTNYVFVINAIRVDNELKLKGCEDIESGEYMKKIIKNAARSIRQQFRREGSVITACQQVRTTILSLRDSLKTFKAPLAERGDMDAVKVVEDLELLAHHAYTHVARHLARLLDYKRAVDLVESPLQVKDGKDSTWAPTTWTGIHAELMTYFVQSIEICRRALDSIATIDDHVTRHMLVQVLALFDEMLYVAEMNPPKASSELCSLGRRAFTEVQAVGNMEQKSCALMMCSPTSTLKVVSGTLELSSGDEGPAWFIPREDEKGRHFRLGKQVVKRLVDVPPERQPLFQGCTHIIELSAAEMRDAASRLQEFIVRPLLDSGEGTERSSVNSS